MARVALLTMSDGRDFVARDRIGYCCEAADAVAAALDVSGHQVERGAEPVSTSDIATSSARRPAASQPDLTIFHYPVWVLPLGATAGSLRLPGPSQPTELLSG
jgi:L-fucose/D-arabinose isomerase